MRLTTMAAAAALLVFAAPAVGQNFDRQKFSDFLKGLPTATTPGSSDIMPMRQGGTTKAFPGGAGAIVTKDGSQEIKNKTIDYNQNTITNLPPPGSDVDLSLNCLSVDADPDNCLLVDSGDALLSNSDYILTVDGDSVAVSLLEYPPINVMRLGAKCDGTTDDTNVFATALFAGLNLTTPPRRTCLVKDLELASLSIDCNGSTLQLASGGSYIARLSGTNPGLVNCRTTNPGLSAVTSTTLAATANPGDTSISVTSGTGFVVGKQIVILLDSGASFTTVATSVSGTTIGIANPIPSSVTAATSGGGDSGCIVGDTLIAKGWLGAPPTFKIASLSGSAADSIMVEAPGFTESALPSNPVAVETGSGATCATPPSLNLTASGAASGQSVKTGYGLIWINNAFGPNVERISSNANYFGMQIDGSTSNGTIRNFYNTSSGVAVYISRDPLNMSFYDWKIWGPGIRGIDVNGQTTVAAGNVSWGIAVLGHEVGVHLRRAWGYRFVNLLSDSNRFYGLIQSRGNYNLFTNLSTTATYGKESGPNPNGYGIGSVFTDDAVATIAGFATRQNAAMVHIEADSTALITAWAPLGPKLVTSGTGVLAANCATSHFASTDAIPCQFTPGGRLSIASGQAVMTDGVAGATAIHYLCFTDNKVPVWQGNTTILLPIINCQESAGLSASHVIAGNIYDVYAIYDATWTAKICVSPAWGSLTSRGAGTSDIHRGVTGYFTNATALTDCYSGEDGETNYGTVPKDRGTYLGSFYASGNGEITVNFTPSPASGGSGPVLGLYNAYNRQNVCSTNQDSSGSYTYDGNGTWRPSNNSTLNRVSFLDGLRTNTIAAEFSQSGTTTSSSSPRFGVVLDSTSDAPEHRVQISSTTSDIAFTKKYFPPRLGFRYVQAMETSTAAGAATFNSLGQANSLTVCMPM